MKIKLLYITSMLLIWHACTYKNEEEEYAPKKENVTATPTQTKRTDIVAWLKFEGNLADSSSNQLKTVVVGATAYESNTYNATKSKFSIKLTEGSYILITDTCKSDTLAISFWFKNADKISGSPTLINYGSDALKFGVDGNTGGTYMTINNGLQNKPSENFINTYSAWCHVYLEFAKAGKLLKCQYNGYKDDKTTKIEVKLGSLTLTPVLIDNNQLKIGGNYKGNIDELKIFRRLLSDSEIKALLQ